MVNRYILSKLLALLVGLLCIFLAYNFNSKNTFQVSGYAYGTTWSITSTEYIADHHEKKIQNIINNIDMMASNYKPDSEIALINNSPINTDLLVSDGLFDILSIAQLISKESDGHYDITLGKISSSMGFSPDFEKNVENNPLNRSYELNKSNQTVNKNSLFWFDLSSIAKGYAVQRIHDYLIKNNLPNHLIDIGGEVIISGTNYSEPWKVGIQDPNSLASNPIYIIKNTNTSFLSIATSGEYRNFKTNSLGLIDTHTINPNSLRSIKPDSLSVTVISSKSATYADGYATAFNAMSVNKSIEIANANDIALMLVVQNGSDIELLFSDKWYDFAYE